MRIQKWVRASVLALGAACFVLPVSAQVADETEGIDQIVVSARKREETLSDVPFSLAVQTAEQLRRSGATNIEDISRSVAGFSVQNLGPGQSQVAVRGVSAGQIVRDQPGVKEQVGIYLDESVISLSLFTPDLDLYDLNRVEVLRGPQGTLFGSGSLSGTVRYITNQPSLEETSGQIQIGADYIDDGDFGGNVKGMINVPLSDTVAFRFAGYYTELGGFIDAVQPGGGTKEDVNDGHRYGFRASLLWQPTEDLKIVPRVVYQDIEVNGFPRVDDYNILANPFTTTIPPVSLGDREQYIQLQEEFTDEFFLVDLRIDYDLGDVVLTSISSYSDREVLQVRDATQLTASITFQFFAVPPAVFNIDSPLDDATDLKTFTQEIRLASDTDGPFQWVIGGFYSDIEREYGQTLLVAGFESATGIGTTTSTPGAFAQTDNLFISDIPYDFEQFAFFGEASYQITDWWNVTAGVRYFDFEEERTLNFDGIFAAQTIGLEGETESDGWSPRMIWSFDVTDDTQINLQYARNGFRLGGINDPLNLPICNAADAATFGGFDNWGDEELDNYEIGVRAELLDGRVQVAGAVFYQDIEDLQVTLTAGSCSSRIIFNVEEASSVGFEFELNAELMEGLNLSFATSYIDSEFDSTVMGGSPSTIIAGIKEGNQLPTTPEWQFAVVFDYVRELEDGMEGFVTASWQYSSERFTQAGDQGIGFGTVDLTTIPLGAPTASTFTFDPELPSYDITNLRFGVRQDNWEVAVFVNNLFDEDARLALDQERGTLARVGYLTNQPRTFGITTTIDF